MSCPLQIQALFAGEADNLQVMEGNLRGARQSLVVSPTLSYMKTDAAFSHQLEAARDRDRRLYAGLGPIPPRTRQYHASPLSLNTSPGHARGSSDFVSTAFSPTYTSRTSNQRASSAMGLASGPWAPENFGQGRFPLRESRSHEVVRNPHHEEQDVASRSQESRGSRSPSTTLETLPEDENRPELRRSASATGSIRMQMQDLKGRISSLKQKAQEDNMRRRSLLNLRTPNPFTCAGSWYGAGSTYRTEDSLVAADGGVDAKCDPPARDSLREEDSSDESTPKATPSEKPTPSGALSGQSDHGSQKQSANGEIIAGDYEQQNGFHADDVPEYDEEDGESVDYNDCVSVQDDDLEEGGDSVYEDAVYEMPVAERHEDRVDAFDYEHFFLHSAMGTYSSASRRSSSDRKSTRLNSSHWE